MSLISQNVTATKSHSLGSKVFQKRNYNNALIRSYNTIGVNCTVNATDRSAVGSLVVTFNKPLSSIIGNYGIGANANSFKILNNVNSISKSFATNVDNNGAGNGSNYETFSNNILLSETAGITSITISQSGTGFQSASISLGEEFSDLVTYSITIPQAPNFSFLANIPLIKVLNFGISTGTFSNLQILSSSNLKALIMAGYNTTQPALLGNLPSSLYYLKIDQMTGYQIDLKNYFTGNRIGLNVGQVGVGGLSYSGGASFPKIIADSPDYKIDYILFQNNVYSKLTSNEAAQFLLDFANQVEQVTLQIPASRKIRLIGTTEPLDSVTTLDPTHTITTYGAAKTKIQSLGISLTFS
ncbi:MAG: hypothetical protein DI529_00285 [Chryseobacterium sp.]|nr:MAG: hypothetical protein DI529_00285 [Chryseobacterium sp.]